jgi:hypothetical protein
VILVNGALAAYLARGDRQLLTFLPESEPDRSKTARAIASVLIDRARSGYPVPRGMLIEEIDGTPASVHPVAPFLAEAGFVSGALGMQATQSRQSPVVSRQSQSSITSATSSAAGPASSLRRAPSPPSRSMVSSPFSRRYFAETETETAAETEPRSDETDAKTETDD